MDAILAWSGVLFKNVRMPIYLEGGIWCGKFLTFLLFFGKLKHRLRKLFSEHWPFIMRIH